jgi:hypothetical protein
MITLDEYTEKVVIPAVLRMFRMADTPSARAALEKFAAYELARAKETADDLD